MNQSTPKTVAIGFHSDDEDGVDVTSPILGYGTSSRNLTLIPKETASYKDKLQKMVLCKLGGRDVYLLGPGAQVCSKHEAKWGEHNNAYLSIKYDNKSVRSWQASNTVRREAKTTTFTHKSMKESGADNEGWLSKALQGRLNEV